MDDAPGEQAPGTTPATMPGRNGGQLRRGGYNGGKGGRPPSAVKASLRRDFDRVRHLLKDFANDDSLPHRDRIRAIDVLGKYGLDSTVSIADVRECLRQTQGELATALPAELFEVVWKRIVRHWLKL